MARKKKKTQMDIIIEFCNDHGIEYKQFQEMESLGIVMVANMYTSGYIRILDLERFNRHISEVRKKKSS